MDHHFPKYGQKESLKADWQTLIQAHSPYLSANLEQLPSLPSANLEDAFQNILAENVSGMDTDGLMRHLRLAKKKVATLAAISDLGGKWDDVTVMQKLSAFADFCVRAALRHLLLQAHAQKKIKLPTVKEPEKGCGVCVIALGKWGAHELNYSSDIDLMVVFDPAKSPLRDKNETQNFFIRLTKDLARLIDQPTEDGYVFRTDLRLRPDPGAMPLAVSIGTAEMYYGSLGQNWERAAMIKARPVAGDEKTGNDFTAIMKSWIWRKNLDFAAIQDIHSIKRQINAKQKAPVSRDNPFLGFNVKLGHGGIREIEFFAQTQQLVFGGKQPDLRVPATLAALDALEKTGHIDAKTRSSLHDAYLFLRRTEHRLQMIDDRQTHSLPTTAPAFKNFSAFMGYASAAELTQDLKHHTDAVKKLYAGLFTESPSLAGPGNLVFTGVEDDPDTLATIKKMGFREPKKVTAAVRGWHHGRYRAMRGEKARQILTELVPHLLHGFAATPHPDEAFIRFDAFLAKLPSGIPIFSMFARNPEVMELVAAIMGASPALADYLGTHPQVLDGVLSKDFFGRLPVLGDLKKELTSLLATARDYQDVLDITRRWAREKRFHAGIHILKNLSPAAASAHYLADIAETSVSCLLPQVENEFAKQHGRFKTGELVVISMGSFAARRMFFDSDLDIVGLYKVSPKEKQSSGAKPLPAGQYYIRLMQRLITALEAPTAEGILYKTDTRLRPAGSDGPLAVSFDAFFEYQKKSAWVWEHMSLIRSHTICAKAETAAEFEKEKKKVLCGYSGFAMPPKGGIRHAAKPPFMNAHAEHARLDPVLRRGGEEHLKKEIRDMREKVEKQFGSKDPWNMKYARGGIMDIMFVAHFLMLKNGIFRADIQTGLELLFKKKLLTKKNYDTLHKTLGMAEAVQGFLRLCAELPFSPEKASDGLKAELVRHALLKKKMTFREFSKTLAKNRAEAFAVYRSLIK